MHMYYPRTNRKTHERTQETTQLTIGSDDFLFRRLPGYPVASPWPIGKKVNQPRSIQIIKRYKKRVMFACAQISPLPHSAKFLRSTLSTTSFHLSPRTLQRHFPIFRQITTMSSATSFFDFEPLDSTYRGVTALFFPHHTQSSAPKNPIANQPSHTNRKGRTLSSFLSKWQGRASREHSLEMRLHTPV